MAEYYGKNSRLSALSCLISALSTPPPPFQAAGKGSRNHSEQLDETSAHPVHHSVMVTKTSKILGCMKSGWKIVENIQMALHKSMVQPHLDTTC